MSAQQQPKRDGGADEARLHLQSRVAVRKRYSRLLGRSKSKPARQRYFLALAIFVVDACEKECISSTACIVHAKSDVRITRTAQFNESVVHRNRHRSAH